MFAASRIAADLHAAVDEGSALVAAAPEPATARRPAGGGWCIREVIGHLLDSACNNHRRFIINQAADAGTLLIIDPYDQADWNSLQHYADRPAADLLAFWAAYNRHLAHVIAAIPDDVLNRPRGPIARLGSLYIPTPDADATIGYLAADYVAHLRHHLDQVRRLLS